jgi:hypothetical protein
MLFQAETRFIHENAFKVYFVQEILYNSINKNAHNLFCGFQLMNG